jgi:cytochrome oxidase Cu insertion factor (SCO1/SenC/PrrC family)
VWRAALVLVAAAVALLAACQRAEPLPVLGTAPTYSLVDQTGQPFGSEQLRRRVALVDFIYTTCRDTCPTQTATFAQVQQRLGDEGLLGSRVALVSISVDPLHDTPAVLADYGERHGADPRSWKLLTGDWDAVYDVVAGFKVGVRTPRPVPDAPPPGGSELTHSTRFVLVDAEGQVRAYLPGTEVSATQVMDAVKQALS